MKRARSDLERFNNLVRIEGSHMIWVGAIDGRGRPTFWCDGKNVSAHRWAWSNDHGKTPGYLRRVCDRRGCVAPDHHLQITPDRPKDSDGLCLCGCGQTTPIAVRTRRMQGQFRGHHVKYVPGHWFHRTDDDHELRKRLVRYTRRDGQCLRFTGARDRLGRGVFHYGGAGHMAHREAWRLWVADPPPAHLYRRPECQHPDCINPKHYSDKQVRQ